MEQAHAVLAPLGDIARIDLTLAVTTGRILVTYFDIRAAQQALVEFAGSAEFFPPAAHDFRAVSIAATVFADLPSSFGGFHDFGEIAGVSICDQDMVVEFYDMRAAQQVTFSIPGSRPRRNTAQSGEAPAPASLPAARFECSKESPAKCLQPGLLALAAAGASAEPLRVPQPTAEASPQPQPQPPQPQQPQARATSGTQESAAVDGNVDSRAASKPANGSTTAGHGKPVREKVNSKDLTKFDIIPEKIRKNEDHRTTVMVRNIPKACSREAFVELLAACGLDERYSFFYMPFDKRRNIHCGFAFANFKTPQDVLQLYECMQTSLWRGLANGTAPPALSYARLQGQEQLIKHFRVSAVMYDNDARKRPIFCAKENGEANLEGAAGALSRCEPQYIPLPGAPCMKGFSLLGHAGEDGETLFVGA